MTEWLTQTATLVVKVGSSLVTNDGRGLDAAAIARAKFCQVCCAAPPPESEHVPNQRTF